MIRKKKKKNKAKHFSQRYARDEDHDKSKHPALMFRSRPECERLIDHDTSLNRLNECAHDIRSKEIRRMCFEVRKREGHVRERS